MKISAFLCKSDLVTTEKSEKELKLRGVRFHLVLKTRFFAPNVSSMPPSIFFQEKLVKLQRGIQAKRRMDTNFGHNPAIYYNIARALKLAILRLISLEWQMLKLL